MIKDKTFFFVLYEKKLTKSGSLGTFTYDAGVGGPIVADKVAVRLSGLMQHRNDWVDNTFAGYSSDSTRTPQKSDRTDLW